MELARHAVLETALRRAGDADMHRRLPIIQCLCRGRRGIRRQAWVASCRPFPFGRAVPVSDNLSDRLTVFVSRRHVVSRKALKNRGRSGGMDSA